MSFNLKRDELRYHLDDSDAAPLIHAGSAEAAAALASLPGVASVTAGPGGGQTFGTTPEDVTLAVLPLFHVYGLPSILNGATRYGRIIRGGFNVYPREVEELLYRHPAVLEAAVVGRPDPRLGEEIQAFVVLRADSGQTAEDVRSWVKERIAAYKYPREVRLVDALPKGPTGKIHKQTLRNSETHGRTS